MSSSNAQSWKDQYRIAHSEIADAEIFAQQDMNDDGKLLAFLELLAGHLQSPARQVTGSLFVKRYGVLISGAMYGFMRHREALDLTPERVKLALGGTVMSFVVSGGELTFPGGWKDDAQRRDLYFDHVYGVQVSPMLRRIAELTGVKETTLWGNLSYSLWHWKQVWLSSESLTDEERSRIEDDYAQLTGMFRPQRFAAKTCNPLNASFRKVDNPWEQDKPIVVRSECCLNYCLPGDDRYCYTCPRISDERRLEKFGKAHGYLTAETVMS